MKCVGYGIYEGKCSNKAGTPWTPVWCFRCDKIRKKTVTKQLEEISKELKGKANAKT